VVIPARNEESRIADVVAGLKNQVDLVLVIDDNSQDMTGPIAEAAGCTVFRNERRLGYGSTLRRGLVWSYEVGGSAVFSMDADGQHVGSWVEQGTRLLDEAADVVFANRFAKVSGAPRTKCLSNNFAWCCIKRTIRLDPVCEDVSCGCRAYSRRGLLAAIDTSLIAAEGYAFTHATCVHLHQCGLRLASFDVPAIYAEPVLGTSVTELREFFVWLLKCTPLHNEAGEWLNRLDNGLSLSFTFEGWGGQGQLNVHGQIINGYVMFS
jgi:glycosyltransferase involved in cell wall biosynthesis